MRVIDENDVQLGVMSLQEALRTALQRGYDLVEVSPVAQPPVCRIVDYGKFLYQTERQDRKSKAKQRRVEVKGVRLSLTISKHDADVRRERAKKFLGEGNKVKLEMILRGRENQHRDRARAMMTQFIKDLGDDVRVEQPIGVQGNRFTAIVSV